MEKQAAAINTSALAAADKTPRQTGKKLQQENENEEEKEEMTGRLRRSPAAILHFKQLVDLYNREVWLQYPGWPGEALAGRLILLRFTEAPSELPEVASGGRNAA